MLDVFAWASGVAHGLIEIYHAVELAAAAYQYANET
jgi:hypothetical protein